MKAGHLRMLVYYDLRSLRSQLYDGDNLKCEPSKMIEDNETVISMPNVKRIQLVTDMCQGDITISQGTALNEQSE